MSWGLRPPSYLYIWCVMSFFSSTWINGASMPQVVLRAGDIPPPLNDRYFTQLDGQSKFFRREAPWACVDPVVEITFLGNTAPTTYFLFDGVDATDRAFLYTNASNGLLNTNAATIELNSAVVSNAAVAAVVGKLNKVIVTFSGSYRLQTLGARFSQDSLFAPTIIESIRLIDPADTANTFNYPMNKNLPYDLPDGEAVGPELPSATRDFSSGGPWDNGTFTRSNTIGVWSTDAGGIGPRTDGASLLGSDFWLISWSDLVDSDIYLNLDGALSLVSTASSGTQVVGIGSATTTAQLYLRASSAGTKTLSAFSLRSIPNSALIFENGSIDGSDRLLVTEKQDGSGFDGEEFWADSVKAVSGNATAPTPNSITINETGTALAAIGIDAPAGPITVSGVANITSGQIDISVIPAFAGVAASITSSGPFSFDLDSQGAVNFKRAFNGGAVAEITGIEVTVRYDYATGANPSTYSSEYSDEYA